MSTNEREWTVHELTEHLTTMPQNKKVTLIDADTGYIIPKFAVADCDDGEVTFFPCNYPEMRS